MTVSHHNVYDTRPRRRPRATTMSEAPKTPTQRARAYRARQLAADSEGTRAKRAAYTRAYRARKKEELEERGGEPAESAIRDGRVYAIRCLETGDCYVGSTCQPLARRFAQHKVEAKRSQTRLYCLMNQVGAEAFSIELLEDVEDASLPVLRGKEREWVQRVGNLNSNLPGRTEAEWRAENRDDLNQNRRKLRAKHPEEVRQRIKEWRDAHPERFAPTDCACGGRCSKSTKPKHDCTARHRAYLASLTEQAPLATMD